ncbi:energy-coupling factor transport system substrate-specific component [Paramicrobacterium humi]|uniref:Energy-coupling factor transport system substrate-specific component n=1 Tax=Paramicrobacterium humi TaxID=640635 RepID=A0A1H4TT98_9MICO|nr:ECF transporter S component [Microbacterium humi]SEC59264.1 energy-coupling factor transport system substrate-specific component [Microbacterium humi]
MQTATHTTTPKRRLKWRVVDIVTASIIGVASGVVFLFWNIAYGPLSVPLAFTPGLSALLGGGWLFAGVLSGLIIRKPGAALYSELVAATVSALVGNQWGFSTVIWGVVQGLGAEIVFAIFLYAHYRLYVALLAGFGAGLAMAFLDTTFTDYAALDSGFKLVYYVSAAVSGVIIAGGLSWLAARGLAAAGALDRFAAGREARRKAA